MSKIKFDPRTLELWFTPSGALPVLLNADHVFDKDVKKAKKVDRYRIEVSLACDLNCQYCVVHMNNILQRGRMMTLAVAKCLIKEFNSKVGAGGSIVLIGGEPLLNWEVVRYMITNCIGNSIIFTNALKLDGEKIRLFKKNKTLILTSLDGYSLKHNRSRFYPRVDERFATVCGNIKKAIKTGCQVGIGCVVHSENVAETYQIAEFFTKKLGSRSLSFAYPHFTTEATETNKFSMEKYTKEICRLVEFSKENKVYIDQIGKMLRGIFRRERIISACKSGLSQKAFYPDGSETICTKLDTIKEYRIDDFFKKLPFKNKKCKECVAQNLCGGGCPWDASVFKNEIGVDRRICGHNKALIKYILRDIEKELKTIKTEKDAQRIIKDKYYPIMFPVWKEK